MCGIHGFLSVKEKADPDILSRMGAAHRHRGPDDEGAFLSHEGGVSIALGHKRLSIIDLSPAGRQPMSNEDASVWVIFNGEIYNFRELKMELEGKGHRFRSNSDTEVIVHLYEEVGTECLQRLQGMFAFAVWDARRQSLFLARDRIGKKPLHYALLDDGMAFASEIKALLEHPGVSREIDVASLSKYLTYEYVPAPDSIFKAIKKLKPGHFLLYQDGRATLSKYWDVPLADYPIGYKTEDEYVEELREILARAVERRLIADVPIGIFLSGGIDSGMIAAFATRANQELECFSIGFEDSSFDESRYASAVADALKAKHQLRVFSTDELLQGIFMLPEIVDEPLADASLLPTYLLSKFTAQHVKVALSGDGGDELFAGYPTYQAHRLVTYYDFLPGFLKSTLKGVASCLPVSHNNISADFKIKQFLKGAGVSSEIRFFTWIGAFIESEKKELLSADLRSELYHHNAYENIFAYINESKLSRDLERILYLSMKLYLQDDILVKVDRAGMANSLEVRCPLLDHEFVEFVCRLPTFYKLRGLRTKYILKKAAKGILPDKIIHRPKKGFGIPISRWLTGELKGLLFDYLGEDRIRRQGFFHYPYVRGLIQDHLEKKKDNRKLLWTLLVFQIWYEKFVEGRR
ncbi:MAG: asparagine synthase (glutamine-hydrolyzing) [Deltaproteobacteria bacterium]|nr:asparagine synthase (glutamine-hydrolyzing) [Deltaproteobacteria bacterium]